MSNTNDITNGSAGSPKFFNQGFIKRANYNTITNDYWKSINGSNSYKFIQPINNNSVYIPNLYVNTITTSANYIVSDVRIKENIQDLNINITDPLMTLIPKEYTFINDKDKEQHFGFIAQEVETLFPNLVKNIPNINKQLHNSTVKSINYQEFIPLLLLKIQDLQKQIDIINNNNNNNNNN